MTESERLWRMFAATGRPEDYVRYVRTLRDKGSEDGAGDDRGAGAARK